jgi:chemotaxis protein CheY-P-specific phosphatase CheC
MLTQRNLTELHRELARRGMNQVVEDWEMMTGCEMEVGETSSTLIRTMEEWRPRWKATPVLLMSTRVQGECEGAYHVILPVPLAWHLVKAVLCLPPTVKLDRKGFDEGQMEVMQEMMNLLCGSISSAFQEMDRQLRISTNVDDLRLIQLGPKDSLRGTLKNVGRGLGVTVDLNCDGTHYEMLEVLPFPLARSIGRLFYSA